ncbi:MAG TPA: CDP-archaeol synthase [Chloroflexota bacterium]|nr:CDP-archaeol synthase [Chloroflexota bacterium]
MIGKWLRDLGGLTVRVVWLMFPVVAAGATHVVVLKLDLLNRLAIPLDAGASWRGKRIFGDNKTVRGSVLMPVMAACFTSLEAALASRRQAGGFDPRVEFATTPWIAGFLVGLAYCLAELPNSFLKRRLDIPAGGHSARGSSVQYAVDQLDSVVGCLLALRAVYRPRRWEMPLACLLGSAIHVGIDLLLYQLGVKTKRG